MRIEEILAMEIGDRQFCRTEIQADDVERVLRAALLATCGKEGNSVELYPVEDPHLLERLADDRDHGAECIAQAPMAVAVVADRLYDGAWVENCSAVVWAMCAQAAERQLAYHSVQIRGYQLTDGTMSDEVVRGILDIPESKTVYAVVAIGTADKPASQAEIDDDQLEWQRIHIGCLFCCMANRKICQPQIIPQRKNSRTGYEDSFCGGRKSCHQRGQGVERRRS